MRRTLLAAVSVAMVLLLVHPSAPQAPAEQKTPEVLVAEYNQAIQSHDWPGAIAAAQQLINRSATSAHLYMLANAQVDSGALQDSLATYDRGLTAAQQEKPAEGQPDAAWKDGVASIYLYKGNALLKLHRNADAIDAYTHSADLASNPALAYFNICATLYNTGDMQNAVPACRNAVAANPANANAWFVLGSLLFADGKTDAQGKFVITTECRDALEKYRQLAPDGPHAADVKEMLDMVRH